MKTHKKKHPIRSSNSVPSMGVTSNRVRGLASDNILLNAPKTLALPKVSLGGLVTLGLIQGWFRVSSVVFCFSKCRIFWGLIIQLWFIWGLFGVWLTWSSWTVLWIFKGFQFKARTSHYANYFEYIVLKMILAATGKCTL